MSSLSNSDSDSDREPNSRGARVFWGNLKTPERSRSNFANPPKTVVKSKESNKQLRSRSISPLMREGNAADVGVHEEAANMDGGETPKSASLRYNLNTGAGGSAMDVDLHSRDIQQPGTDVDYPYEGAGSALLRVPSPQSLLVMLKTTFSDVGSESEVEDTAVLQPLSPVDSLVDDSVSVGARDLQDSQPARLQSLSPIDMSFKGATHTPRASQLPDLISFTVPTPTRLSPTNPTTDPSLHPDTATNQSTLSSSGVTIDDLLTLSPQRTKDQLPPRPSSRPDHFQSSEYPVVSSLALSPPMSQLMEEVTTIGLEQSSTFPNELASTTVGPVASHETLSHAQANQTSDTQLEVGTAPDVVTELGDAPCAHKNEAKARTPEHTGNVLTHTPGAETRKRTPAKAWKSRTNADDGGGTLGESSANTSNESNGESTRSDEDADRAIKKERRAKAKQEAERKRPLLMSLSPTSADVLKFLASPGRGSPLALSPPRALGDMASELISIDTPSQSRAPTTPQPGPSTPARRVPITFTSPRRMDGPSLHLKRPNPVHLDDPNRTPARRVPLPSFTSQIQSRALPLDDPNRTPARRVALVPPSPFKKVESSITLGTQPYQAVTSHAFPTKPATESLPPGAVERPKENDSASTSTASSVAKSLPFPIIQQSLAGGKPGTDSSDPSSPPESANSPLKPPPSSNLRQPSSTSASKIGRAVTKPYSRPIHMQSKLPKPSSSRLPVPGGGFGSTSGAGPSRVNAQPAAAPTRIPSPVKQRAPPVENPDSAPVPLAPVALSTSTGPPVTSTYRRKRQRMMSEDGDSDEPPAKRPTIVVRHVRKGMFNQASLPDSAVPGSSTSHGEISPVHLSRSPGPLQIRPVIPGTLRHFETTRSSSRDLIKSMEESARTDTDPPDSPVPGPSTPPRHESPIIDTDTASTVTTLSREPTLDDMPVFPPSALGPEPSFATLAEPEQELRRTTRVRKSSSASATRRDPLLLTRTTTMMQRGASSSSKTSKPSARIAKTPGIPTNQRQLQALTQANTMRNQTYIADLQRQVVRKDGPRPASPTTKVRTMMEKAKEAHAKGREARAERRRRRGEGSNASTNSEGESVDFKDVSSSPPRDVFNELPTKHVRGPGDEEDYETPERPSSSLAPGKVSKNVKWDRGLARSLSEFAVAQAAKKAREGAAAEAIRKGCLARDAKTLRLDPLGNVPDATIPLDNLGRERVIVTRFIYDDDDDIEATRAAKKKKP